VKGFAVNTILLLENHRDLFKDAAALRQFVQLLEGSTAGNAIGLLVSGEEVVCAFVSPDEARDRLRDRIMKRLAGNPGALDTLRARLESDDLVE
jgi:hypothetical protein